MFDIVMCFKNFYGLGLLYLLVMVFGFVLLGYIVVIVRFLVLWNQVIWWQLIVVWFVVVVVVYDLLLYLFYVLVDWILVRLVGRCDVLVFCCCLELLVCNYIWILVLVVGLMLLVFLFGIIRQGVLIYLDVIGQMQELFLGRWLLFIVVVFGISVVVYVIWLVVVYVRWC